MYCKTCDSLAVWEAWASEHIAHFYVFLWFGRPGRSEVLKILRFSCGLGRLDVQRYCKTLGFLTVVCVCVCVDIRK